MQGFGAVPTREAPGRWQSIPRHDSLVYNPTEALSRPRGCTTAVIDQALPKEDGESSTGHAGCWHGQHGSGNARSVGDQPDLKPTQTPKNFPLEAKIAAPEEVTPQQAEGDVQAGFIVQSLKNMCLGGEIQPKQAAAWWLGKAEAKDGWRQKPDIKLGEQLRL